MSKRRQSKQGRGRDPPALPVHYAWPDKYRLGAILKAGSSRPALRAVVIFCVLIAAFYGLLYIPGEGEDMFRPHLRMVATLTGGMLRVIGH